MLPLAGDIAARFEAGSDRSVGDGRAQHPVDCEGGKEGSLTTHRLIDVPDQRSFTFEAPEPDRARHRADVGSEQWRRHVTCGGRALRVLIWPLPEGIDDEGLERLL